MSIVLEETVVVYILANGNQKPVCRWRLKANSKSIRDIDVVDGSYRTELIDFSCDLRVDVEETR